jgi:hypothetical protein
LPEPVKEGSLAFYVATKKALLLALEWMRIDHKDGLLNLHVLLPGAVEYEVGQGQKVLCPNTVVLH